MLLETKRLWDSSKEDAMRQRIEVDVNAAVTRAEEIAAPPTSDVFDHTFAQLPRDLVRQRDSLQTHSLAGEQAVHTEGH
jgi:pyruvate dehydrogenase E1 component alpha subunit